MPFNAINCLVAWMPIAAKQPTALPTCSRPICRLSGCHAVLGLAVRTASPGGLRTAHWPRCQRQAKSDV